MSNSMEFYQGLNLRCQDILVKTFEQDNDELQSKSHNFIVDLEQWINTLSSRPEVLLLKEALKEYQYSLLALVQGQYRHAYIGLRFFLEQALSAIKFSANELELRLWMQGNRDITWSSLVNLEREKGIFSDDFVGAFFYPLLGEASIYNRMAIKVYRECSEFVHGNFQTYSDLPKGLDFSEKIFGDWQEKAETARVIVLFALAVRYLPLMDNREKREKVESSIMEYLGHIPAIHTFYDEVLKEEAKSG